MSGAYNPYGLPARAVPAAASRLEYYRAAVAYLRGRPMAGSGALETLRHAESALAMAEAAVGLTGTRRVRWDAVREGDVVLLDDEAEFPVEWFRVRSRWEAGGLTLEPMRPADGDDFFEHLVDRDALVEVRR